MTFHINPCVLTYTQIIAVVRIAFCPYVICQNELSSEFLLNLDGTIPWATCLILWSIDPSHQMLPAHGALKIEMPPSGFSRHLIGPLFDCLNNQDFCLTGYGLVCTRQHPVKCNISYLHNPQ